jgi:membrane-bound lytic murein transglycosylase C
MAAMDAIMDWQFPWASVMNTEIGCHSLPRRSFLLGCAALAAGCTSQPGAPVPTAVAAQLSVREQALGEATQRLTAKCTQLWGVGNAKLPTAKTWVSHGDNWKSRGEMDFEHGVFTAQILVDADTGSDSMEAALARLRKRLDVAETITPAELADDDDVAKLAARMSGQPLQVAPPPDPVARETPVLAGILPLDAQSKLSPAALERTPITGGDGRKRVMLTYRVPFEDNHLLTLAARYAGLVRQAAQRHGLRQSLIYAVMETESAFNPRARSAVPAYGLMQLVPKTAGRDAYVFIHGITGEPDPDTLYDPEANIAFGTAYLKILQAQYLKDIEDETSRGYATIAAYNTGAGNVARAFGGTTRIANAAQLINSLPPDEILNRLTAQLPAEETRRYVTAVLARQERYRSFDAANAV